MPNKKKANMANNYPKKGLFRIIRHNPVAKKGEKSAEPHAFRCFFHLRIMPSCGM